MPIKAVMAAASYHRAAGGTYWLMLLTIWSGALKRAMCYDLCVCEVICKLDSDSGYFRYTR